MYPQNGWLTMENPIASPVTFNILPITSSPTGAEICLLVETTGQLRLNPSVSSNAIHLTMLSPKC